MDKRLNYETAPLLKDLEQCELRTGVSALLSDYNPLGSHREYISTGHSVLVCLVTDTGSTSRPISMRQADNDVRSHGKITYTIPSEFIRSMFSADAETGNQLDRERVVVLELPVLATDGAGHYDYSTVRVTVTDVNDNVPEFCFPEYYKCIAEKLTVDSVKASDRGSGLAALVEYSIYNLQSKRVKHCSAPNRRQEPSCHFRQLHSTVCIETACTETHSGQPILSNSRGSCVCHRCQ
ncbi:hypothetical protein J6590_038175 [Homalodisca vitripennis]|nr:hypothetical protein J6590_038175 [Homalodisca vitripennis]